MRASAIVLQRGNCKIHPHSAEKFANAEDAFAALDDDGGGELSRVELARGLRAVRRWVGFVECGGIRFVCTAPVDLYVRVCVQVGIWMTPNELGAFVEALDQVCGGDDANIGCGGGDDAVEARSRHKTHFCRMGAAASRWMSCKVRGVWGSCLGMSEELIWFMLLQPRCVWLRLKLCVFV